MLARNNAPDPHAPWQFRVDGPNHSALVDLEEWEVRFVLNHQD
jgi:hypothetical protein